MKTKYMLTVQNRTDDSQALAPCELEPPPGRGWELHSWQADPQGPGKILLVWYQLGVLRGSQ